VTQLKQNAAAQRDAPSTGMLHSSEEDPSKSHCRQGGKGGDKRSTYTHIFHPLGRIPKLTHLLLLICQTCNRTRQPVRQKRGRGVESPKY